MEMLPPALKNCVGFIEGVFDKPSSRRPKTRQRAGGASLVQQQRASSASATGVRGALEARLESARPTAAPFESHTSPRWGLDDNDVDLIRGALFSPLARPLPL